MLPNSFTERMRAYLGDAGLTEYLRAFEAQPSRALHINYAKADVPCLSSLGASLSPIPYAEDGFYIDSDEKLGNHPLHHAGAFYIQEPSAMMPIASAPITRGMRVLDLCASPGGKTTQLANRIGEEGILVSNEIHPARCATLAGNVERMGLRNTVVTNTDAATLGAALPGFFDAIVVDAPCSGEGMFRKMHEAIDEWTPDLPVTCAERQRQILSQIAPALCPGGLLVYSTCTFSREENEDTVEYFLKTHPEFDPIPLPSSVLSHTAGESEAMRRFYPHLSRGEGQFCALFRHNGSESTRGEKKRKGGEKESRPHAPTARDLQLVKEFLADTLTEPPALTPSLFKESFVLSPISLPLPERVIYASGVTVGTPVKGRIVPHHAFFSAYGKRFCRILELSPDDPRLAAYLHGDTVEADLPNGWAVVCVLGCPIGGIKVTGGVAKNHYPKGLRRMG